MARLRLAGQGCLRRWRTPRAAPRNEDRRRLDALAILLTIAIVIAVAINADEWAARAVAGLPAGLRSAFNTITYLGLSGYMFSLAGLSLLGALMARGRGRGARFDLACLHLAERAAFVIAVLAISGLASQALKHLFGRARPSLIDLVGPFHFDMFAFKSTFASMPSGHTVTAFAAAVSLGWMAPRLRWPLLGLALLIAISRVVISSHYPSDVIAGAGLGTACAILLRRAFALRGLAFRWTPTDLRLRGAGRVWPAFVSRSRP
jgi:undecaprenyl-diphosphatase